MLLTLSLVAIPLSLSAAFAADSAPHSAERYEIVWPTPGNDHRDSVPIGNGDIGANVWTEADGDVVLLLSKTDSWSENGQLLKLGQVRIRFTPSPLGGTTEFRQTLAVERGEVELRGSEGFTVRIWVDANRPVVRVEYVGKQAVTPKATVELWRREERELKASSSEAHLSLRDAVGDPNATLHIAPDFILAPRDGALVWGHENRTSIYGEVLGNQHLQGLRARFPDPLLGRVVGVRMQGSGMRPDGEVALSASGPMRSGGMAMVVLGEQGKTIEEWNQHIGTLAKRLEAEPVETARAAHRKWWDEFWNRSWIDVAGAPDADEITEGYAMQRWMMAAGGRGAQPQKFNGGIFTIGNLTSGAAVTPEGKYDSKEGRKDPDYRRWGGNYWYQNERLLHWPLVAAGDSDLLVPFFRMHRDAVEFEKARTESYFRHAGAIYPETMFFWGTPSNNDFGWGNPNVVMENLYIRYHANNGLEMTSLMLSEYEETQDLAFARDMLVPFADAVVTYFDVHWPHKDGKLHFDPSQSLETDRPAVNPAPDIAGLMNVLPRLQRLPTTLITEEQRSRWKRMLGELPALPRGSTNGEGKHPEPETAASPTGRPILYTAAHWEPMANGRPGNVENPELYSVFPYMLFGVGLPELDLARNTFAARRFADMTCWTQNGMDAAVLGMAAEARRQVAANFTAYGTERFRWFWREGHDWEPDLDNGGVGMMTLQLMLLQARGDKLLLFPAWPKEWDVKFKLHAPGQTVVEGSYRAGKLERLVVTPSARRKDIVMEKPQ